jgi:lipoprotein-anchoring transpeptidase ErfK/SrfK
MRSRSFIIVAGVLGVFVAAAIALVVYDSTRNDHIAEGVRVGGVEVGGLTRAEARAKVASELRSRLDQPIVVYDGRRQFHLTPRQAAATFHIGQMVDEAVRRSREGNIFSRTWRDLRGESLNADIPASVQYSHLVLARFVNRVEEKLNHKPVDAHLNFHPDGFTKVPGKRGVIIDSRAVHNDVEAAILGTRAATIQVHLRKTAPKVTLKDLTRVYSTLLTINRSEFKLRLYKHLRLVKTYPIAVGQLGYSTPSGIYHIDDRTVDPTWYVPPNATWAGSLAGHVIPPGPENPLKARWLGFGGGRGIHGTADDSSIGSAASHGCIRMHVSDVVQLYPRVPLNTPLYIV